MPNKKLSEIASGGSVDHAIDKLIAVRNGNTNVLVDVAAYASSLRTFNVLDYGAKLDGKLLIDITTTNGSAVITSASYSFTSADVGKCVAVKDSATAATFRRVGVISSVSSGAATLSGTIGASVAGTAHCYFGTDDTAAFQAAVAAANPVDSTGAGFFWEYRTSGTVIFPSGIAMITAPIAWRTGVSMLGQGSNASVLMWVSTHAMAQTGYYAAITGVQSNAGARTYYDVLFADFTVDMTAAFVSSYNYHAKCFEFQFMSRAVFQRLKCLGSPGTAIGVDFLNGCKFMDNTLINSGRLWVSAGGGGSAFDFQTNASSWDNVINPTAMEATIVSGNIIINPRVSGIRNTDGSSTLANTRTIISNNIIVTNLNFGKGIEDCGHTGAIIIGNTVINTTTQTSAGTGVDQEFWGGILSYGGNYGQIIGNTVIGGYYDGIKLHRFRYGGSTLEPCDYIVANNTVKSVVRHGIRLEVDDTYLLKSVQIQGNHVSLSGAAGIAITNNGTGGNATNMLVSGNQTFNNGRVSATDTEKSGILIETATAGLLLNGNQVYDDGPATQKYGVTVKTVAVTDAIINGNHLSGNTTSAINLASGGTIAGEIYSNKGYHLGPTTVVVGSSPWTYTAGATPEVLYLTGGTVSSVTRGGLAISSPVYLNPNESVVTTYSAPPTAVVDKK